MKDVDIVKKVLIEKNQLDLNTIFNNVNESLFNADDGELFLEYVESERLLLEDSRIKSSNFNISSGFGLRAIYDDLTVYSNSSVISNDAIIQAGKEVNNGSFTRQRENNTIFEKNYSKLYINDNPLITDLFTAKIKLLQDIDTYLRNKNPLVKQVTASITGEWQVVTIIKPGEQMASDIRPLVRLNISVIVEKNGRIEAGSVGVGGRNLYKDYIAEKNWQEQADEALRQALVMVEAIPAPAGEMKVVLGPGWPGILLHEAVGHGLEGDFNRKKLSAFSDLIGKQVAAKGVTVIDDGTIPNRRGSLSIDDEGTKTNKTVLIEDGILKGYIFDRMNARLMGMTPTGNGRRESYGFQPMPRMTNTYMLGGKYEHDEIIKMVDHGIYAVSFGGGQVDITSGKFVFSAAEAYLVENGKITKPIKGATIIGSGHETLKKIKAIGNNMQLDKGIGTCGKNGQSVPVGVGQPTLYIDGITVGGNDTH